MFNEFFNTTITTPSSVMKPSTTDYFRLDSQGFALPTLSSHNGLGPVGTSGYSGSPLFGLSGLCDQFMTLSSGELSASPPEYNFNGNKDLGPVGSGAMLGSSLHNSVSRSYSDSSRQDRTKTNDSQLLSGSPNPTGWPVTDADSGFVGSDPWPVYHVPLSKSHSDVFRTSSNLSVNEEGSINKILEEQESDFLWKLRQTCGNMTDFEILRKQYNYKVLFAIKLGYTEDLLQAALSKLGLNAGENQILEELIKLQKSREGANPPLSKQSSDDRGSSSSVRIEPCLETEPDLLPIVIDGSNVAMSHGNKERFSCKGIKICVDWFLTRGHNDITVFVPAWRKESPKPDSPITDQHLLLELEKEGHLSFTPSRQVAGRRFVCHDDRYILNLAAATGAIVVSNDNYRELVNEKSEYKKVIEEKILMYTFVSDRFMPPDDPLGRNGPTLETFLRKPKYGQSSHTQPCPYEKKCTYGNKCKYYHADRGNQPQKSISEKLKESSSRKLSEVRARSPANESGDQLIRTKSMQPVTNSEAARFLAKQSLSRTKSLNPNLERGLQPQIWPQLGNHVDGERVPNPPLWGTPQSYVVMNSQNPAAETQNVRFSLDTSKPPPAPPQWHHQMDSGGNTHKKLARQLTLNPTYDPRIHGGNFIGESSGDPFSIPPPNLVGNFPHHFSVKRNVSAPEQANRLLRSPVPNVVSDRSTGLPIFQQQTYRGIAPHLMNADMKLCKSKSE